ncbi:oligopeptide transporter [Talaromyces proteolyticus]|uniref:Oligopeptide transporter n=1 Tax=Talaromyces proteolyticus TaxID=1131652 RepID=A0AAD4KP96_9EURO|nr:oligopeptide transporter [Talaromyces proteolyticus]KAH8696354.1 oligopeptide transporter [Talaromyces proteolyticus]
MPATSERTRLLPERDEVEPASVVRESEAHLRRVADSFPRSVWLIATIEFCERFAYFGIVGPMQNYMQNAMDDPLHPGGIGLGQAQATMINQGFLLWCFLTPSISAVVADQYIGRLKTIMYSSAIYSCGLVVLCLSSISLAYDIILSRLALLLALVLIGIGTGGIKTNVSSLIAEQITGPSETIRVTKYGEKVVVDRDLTIQSIFSMFFLFINVGSFAAAACTAIEQRYGFTMAFALPTVIFITGFTILLISKDGYISRAPESSVILHACRAFWIAIRHGGNLDYARPGTEDSAQRVPWDNSFVDDLKRISSACKVFLLYPFYWAACTQFATNFVSQASTMETHGIPNDILVFLDPVTAIILLPILDRIVFPYFERIGKPVDYVHRMTAGFMFCGAAMLYAAFVQWEIYAAPPCYNHPRARDCVGGSVPNQVSIYVQAPAYMLIATSEILAAVAGIEYAYTKAPASMKSLVMAVYLTTTSVGALLAVAVSPLTVDPKLVWMYITLSMGPLMAGVTIWSAPIAAPWW